MGRVLVIDDDPATLFGFEAILTMAGHEVVGAACGTEALDVLKQQTVDLVLTDLRLPDMSGLDVLRQVRQQHTAARVVVVTGFGTTRDVVSAVQLGATDVLEKPVLEEGLLATVAKALSGKPATQEQSSDAHGMKDGEAHAAARLARVIVAVIDSRTDVPTIGRWSRCVFVSSGALRNWCRTAGMSPRRVLVFARLLRAAARTQGGRYKLENLLDVVDRRTLAGLLRFAGLNVANDFPVSIDAFLERQTLILDESFLSEINRAIAGQRPQLRAVNLT